MPFIADKWEDKYNLLGLGVWTKFDSTEDKVYARTHYAMVCLAIVMTEVFVASRKVH